MRLKSLRLENFRQFRGTNKLEFAADTQKNVTIILGDNTFGKSTLLQAFSWCLYEKANFIHRSNFLLNYEISEELPVGSSALVEVELTLLHGGNEYIITRSQNYKRLNDKTVLQLTKDRNPSMLKVSRKEPNGETVPIHSKLIPDTINNILPEHLSSYFFFDTERVNSISSRQDIVKAVKGLLGLSIIGNALRHLGARNSQHGVISNFYRQLDNDGTNKTAALEEKMKSLNEAYENIQAQIEECKNQIAQYENRRAEINKILLENKATSQLQADKEKFERKLAAEKNNLAQRNDNFFKEFNASAIPFFAQPLLKKVVKILKENAPPEQPEVLNFSRITMQKILRRGYCICGRKFKVGDKIYKQLEAEMSAVPQETIENAVQHYLAKVETFAKLSEPVFEHLESSYAEVLRARHHIQEISNDIFIIEDKISGKENMKPYQDELLNIERKIRELQTKNDRLNQSAGAQKNEQERLKKEYYERMAKVETNKETLRLMGLAEKVKEFLDQELQTQESSIRKNLEAKVSEIFNKMYSGTRQVSIDDDYNVHLLTTVADSEFESGESEGSNRVKNFAFIAGLVSLARDKIFLDKTKLNNAEQSFELSDEPYPLVMDAPFSNVDEIHTRNIAKFLPEFAEQIVMFVMLKDWRYAEPVMKGRIGRQYSLEKVSETFTKII